MNVNMGDYLIPKEIYDELFSDYIELVQREEHLQQENHQLKDRINKAVEILNNENESCQGALTNPEYTIVSKHQLLKNDINIIKKLIDLLKGDKE